MSAITMNDLKARALSYVLEGEIHRTVITAITYIMVLLIPLAFVLKNTLFIEAEIVFVEGPKVFLFRVLTAISLPFVVYGMMKEGWRIHKNKFGIGIVIYFGWIAIATLQSRDISISFWGEFLGQDSYSLLTNLHYLVLVLGIVVVFDTKEKLISLFKVISVSGAIASVPVILQYYSGFPIDLFPQGVGRPPGTFGNPVFAGAFLSLTTMCTAYLALKHERMYGLLIIPQAVSLLMIQSRAGILSLVIFAAVITLFSLKAEHRVKKVLIYAGALVILSIGAFLTGGIDRFKEAPSEITGRTTYWVNSGRLIIESPVFGFGPDMFRYFYLQVSPASIQGIPEEPDHAHNWIIHNMVEMGIPGGITSGAALIGPVFFVNPFLGAIFLGHAGEQMFGVGRISDLMIFYILIGVAYNAYSRRSCSGF